MGSCISKCRPKKKFKKDCNCIENFSHVHDKLVISQATLPVQNPVSPSPSATSSTSFCSVSAANSSSSSGFSMASSLSSSSSCSSSVSIMKDRSFSNEFLWSCVKENPHIIGRNVIKGSPENFGMSNKVHPSKFDFPSPQKSTVLTVNQSITQKIGGSTTPKKRARANSPMMVRQKSFRKEPDKVNSSPTYHIPSKTPIRSPSPSRRFNGEGNRDSSMNAAKEIYSRKLAVPKANFVNHRSSSMRKESFRIPPSPNYDMTKKSAMSKSSRDALITHEIGSRCNEIGDDCAKEASQDLEAMLVEDISNPLIALDCFIFL